MKTIGMIAGLSWESSLDYYRIINEMTNKRLGGLHSAKIVMYSVDFQSIEEYMRSGSWDQVTKIITDAAQRIEMGGADFIIICTNTLHKIADELQTKINIPILNIIDSTASKIKENGIRKVGLLGTKFTMEEDFYKGRLQNKHGIEVITPDFENRQKVNEIIFTELCRGNINPISKDYFKKILNDMALDGAEAAVLGCTEIPLLISRHDVSLMTFDTTRIHAEAAVEYALN